MMNRVYAHGGERMKELRGISASPGIAIGKAFVYAEENFAIPRYYITTEEVEQEVDRFRQAVGAAIEEIEALRHRIEEEMGDEESKFLGSQVMMLTDEEFLESVDKNIRLNQKNVEWIFLQVVEDLIEKLNASEDEYLRERTLDIHDVSRRVLGHLLYRDRISLGDLVDEVILITRNLLPSDILAMNRKKVKGIAMDVGGRTSHTAILARSFELPAVLGLFDVSRIARTGEMIIIDGVRGRVILDPDEDTIRKYEGLLRKWQQRELQLQEMNEFTAETTSGRHVLLMANIEVPEEVESVQAHGADGVGLFRSEFLFLQPRRTPSEVEQIRAYSSVLQAMGGKQVTIRTLDLGGDKVIPEMEGLAEKNPILGWRAIRFCLSRTDIFRTQLRALLRSSVHGDLRIMFPMISGIEELDLAMEMLETVKDDLRREGQPFREDLPVGCMIEVPSAAITADVLAKRVKFFSIGTNDLIQYTIAVDRGNEKIAYLYEPFHPGVLRLIRQVIDAGHRAGISVNMCGEMAGDPFATVLLLGMGLDEFSMSAFSIPEVKRIIRSVSMTDAEALVQAALSMSSAREINEHVRCWMEERFAISPY